MSTYSPKGVGAIAIVVIVVVLIVIGGGIWYAASQGDSSANTNDDAMMEDEASNTNDDATMEDTNSNTNEAMENAGDAMEEDTTNTDATSNTNTSSTAPGDYTDYSEATFATAADQQRVLFFHATWCPTCKVANTDLTANEGDLPDNVVVFKTDYDTQPALKAKYGITYQHTFVLVDAAGESIKKWNGGGVSEIIENVS